MNNDFARTASMHTGSNIDEHGFTAILRHEEAELSLAGIIGGPRVNPTSGGLCIEDSYPAAIDVLTICILEEFVRRECTDERTDLMDRAGSRGRDRMRRISRPERDRALSLA